MSTQSPGVADERPRFLFTGRVQPERYGWSAPPVDGGLEMGGHSLSLRLTITRSQAVAELRGSYEGPMADLMIRVQDICQGVVDALGFGFVAGLELEMLSCVGPDGHIYVFAPAFDELRKWPPEPLSADEEQDVSLLSAASGNVFGVRAALADLRQAVRAPADTLFYCYRAIEAIRQELIPAETADAATVRRQSWQAVRDLAGIDESQLRWLVPEAVARRHGELLDVSADARMRALRLARQVVLAFVRGQAL
jgi:hypothetical protein